MSGALWKWVLLVIAIGGFAPLLYAWAMKWIGAPIEVKRTQRNRVRAGAELARPERLTPEMVELVETVKVQLEAEKFDFRATLFFAEGVPNSRAMQAMFVDPGSNDLGVVIGVWTVSAAAQVRSTVMTVRSHFADGTTISTVSSRGITCFPSDPKVDVANFWWVGDARVLCEAHRRRVRAAGRHDHARLILRPGGEVGYAEREWEDDMRRWQRLGYYREPSGDFYSLTWKGAFLMSWRLTEPVRAWRMRRRDRKSRRLWRELGMEEFRVPDLPGARVTERPAVVSHGHEPSTGIGYETALREGEIRRDWSEGVLTVRAETVTVGRYLARRWFAVAFAAFGLAALGLSGFIFWRYYTGPLWWRRAVAPPPLLPVFLILPALVWDLFSLLRGVLRLGRPIALIASWAGLEFRNLPLWRSAGHIVPGGV